MVLNLNRRWWADLVLILLGTELGRLWCSHLPLSREVPFSLALFLPAMFLVNWLRRWED